MQLSEMLNYFGFDYDTTDFYIKYTYLKSGEKMQKDTFLWLILKTRKNIGGKNLAETLIEDISTQEH